MLSLGFQPTRLSEEDIAQLQALRSQCATDIVTMTALAGCGHPGGSLSSLDILLLLYANANISASAPMDANRDRIIVSHGHISPAVYGVLAAFGFCDSDEACATFRTFGSVFGGHIEMGVPGVEWNTGNLGQGLSAGVGAALGARLRGADPSKDLRDQDGAAYKVVVAMGDGEQQKGQIAEARRLAVKYGCTNLIAVVDYNRVQIGGDIAEIMPQDIAAGWAADGWNVLSVDGHDYQELYAALRAAWRGEIGDAERPTVLLARTVMGKGADFMEVGSTWHGKAPSFEQARAAIAQFGGTDRLDALKARRDALPVRGFNHPFPTVPPPQLELGPPIIYGLDKASDCRSAYGAVMDELSTKNNQDKVQVVAFSADLEGSVKLNAFHASAPAAFIEGGIQEHNTAVASGRLSREGYSVFYSTFGMFGVTEVFNQQRLNSYNKTNLKLACTHCGADVGEDGPTHQMIDYAGLLRSTFDWEIFFPADANQCDRIVRAVASREGNQFVGMGRSKLTPLSKADGSGPFYDGTVGFEPGCADTIREGDDGAILAFGPLVIHAQRAADRFAAETGKRVRVVNMASLQPFDRQAVIDAANTGYLLSVEDHHPATGLGGIAALVIAEAGIRCKLERAGIDRWGMSGKPLEIFAAYRLDGEGILERLRGALG